MVCTAQCESTSAAATELTALAPHLGVHRVYTSTYGGGAMGTLSALATALAPHVWPERYAGLKPAIALFNDGKQESTCKLHHSKVNKLIQALGGTASVHAAVIAHQANTNMQALAAASEIEPTVSVIIGLTGEPSRPVVLRLFVVSRSAASEACMSTAGSSTLMPLNAPACDSEDWETWMLTGIDCDALRELEHELCLSRDRAFALHRSRTPSPAHWMHELHMRDGVLFMVSSEEQWEYPPGTVVASEGCIPALCDDGASYDASCSRTLRGAMLDTYSSAGECHMGVGTNDSGLESKGSYVFVFERFGSDGSGELVARRMRHTPNLPVHMVFSEGAEVYSHNYQFVFTSTQGRVMTTSTGKQVPLYMGAHTKLG